MRGLVVWAVLAACGTKESTPVVREDGGAKTTRYDYQHWVKKLASEHERAVTELEQLGNPAAIPALVTAWEDQDRPIRTLEVIIGLARPLTPEQAKAKFLTDYERTGRKASWDAALPALVNAVEALEPDKRRTHDAAVTAATALGDAGIPAARPPLVALAKRPAASGIMPAKVAAIRALGNHRDSARTLIEIVESPSPAPTTSEYRDHIIITGAAVTSLGELRDGAATSALVLAMYRYPELFAQFRRALVALGPPAKAELKQILLGTHEAVIKLFQTDLHDDTPVAAIDYRAAIVIGDFRDPDTTGALLVALQHPMHPIYDRDGEPLGITQGNAILDALKKIGAPSAAAPLLVLWRAGGDLPTRILAISAYPFVSRDGAGIAELGKIAGDNKADDQLRQQAALAFARLSRAPADIAILDELAKRYLDASAKKVAEAKKLARPTDPKLAGLERQLEVATLALRETIKDTSTTAAQIKRQTVKVKKLDDAVRAARRKQRDSTMPLRQTESAATAYLGYARMFQTHMARIEVAARCQDDLACFAKELEVTSTEVAAHLRPYIKDLADWTPDELKGLREASIDRAMIQLGKAGPAAAGHTDALLDHFATDPAIREAILLALPKIAKRPCATCIRKLDAAIASQGSKLGPLEVDTQIVRDHLAAP